MFPVENRKVFYKLLANNLVATITNMFVWFSLTFWAYLQTESVIVTSFIAGTFAIASMISAIPFGSLADNNKKKTAMLFSSIGSLVFYVLASIVYFSSDPSSFTDPASPTLWILIVLLMLGSTTGNLRNIALATTVSLLFESGKDQANGLVGMVNGVGFSITSIFSGLAIGFFGFGFAIAATIICTLLAIFHLLTVTLAEEDIVRSEEEVKAFDFKKTILIISGISGLFTLIFFTTLNNLIGGVFMALLDAYGLSLVSVKTWGIMFAIASVGFVIGSMLIAKFGLGKNPLRSLLIGNGIAWFGAFFIAIQPSVVLLLLGMLVWMSISPLIEAAEQTVIQTVVPYEKQGRVFGFAQSVESLSSPITSFLIGPITAAFVIPFMSTGWGAEMIGDWFGTGPARGMALVFTVGGILGLIVTAIALRSKSYTILTKQYLSSLKENTKVVQDLDAKHIRLQD